MGLFDKFKNKKEDIKIDNSKINEFKLGFCTCGNLTDSKYCDVCSQFISNKKKFSQSEFDEILHDKIIIPLSSKYGINFEEISLKDHFNLDEDEESHILYRLMRAIVYEEINEDISEFFENLLDETKKKKDIEETIMDNIKSDIIEEFYNDGYVYDILLTTTPSGFVTVENSYIEEKHSTGAKVLATALIGPLGFVATSGVKRTTESKTEYVEGEYLHNQYSFDSDSIIVKSYSDNRNFNAFRPKGEIDKLVISWNNINYIDEDFSVILKSDDVIQLIPPHIRDITHKYIFDVIGTNNWKNNKQLHNQYAPEINKKTRQLFVDLLNKFIKENNQSSNSDKETSNSSIEELEKIVNMYDKGLLSDEEFIKLKKKLIDN